MSYNGHRLHEFVPQRTSAYVGQNDVHLGQMTVRETLQFSARCQGTGTRYGRSLSPYLSIYLSDTVLVTIVRHADGALQTGKRREY